MLSPTHCNAKLSCLAFAAAVAYTQASTLKRDLDKISAFMAHNQGPVCCNTRRYGDCTVSATIWEAEPICLAFAAATAGFNTEGRSGQDQCGS